MTEQEKQELEHWIERLQTKEGRNSFKRTMCASDKDVDYEIDLARRVLFEQEQYDKLMSEIALAARHAQEGYGRNERESDEQSSACLIQKALY